MCFACVCRNFSLRMIFAGSLPRLFAWSSAVNVRLLVPDVRKLFLLYGFRSRVHLDNDFATIIGWLLL